jgi:alkanesulfonate monooxygenase SsuD/methylene tetrahydromethanopterin reductase-like flavin-dependent oxidoreductase (luciferase family)
MDQLAKRPLKVGLVLAQIEGWIAGGSSWQETLALARRAEAVGFDSLWVVDHLLYRYPFEDPDAPSFGLWECWSWLAALAAATTRIELGPLVSATTFRNPALLAKIAETVDEISGGRLILGLGAGYHEREYSAFGFPFDHLVSRFEEALAIIHPLLRAGEVDFSGTYYQARQCELRPRGPRPSGPPILIGAGGKRTLGVTARYADLWNAWSCNSVESVVAQRAAVDAACLAVGRDPSTLARTVSLMVDLPDQHISSTPNVVTDFRRSIEEPASGSTDELANLLRAYAREGISHVQVWLEPTTVAGIEAFAPVLELLDRG